MEPRPNGGARPGAGRPSAQTAAQQSAGFDVLAHLWMAIERQAAVLGGDLSEPSTYQLRERTIARLQRLQAEHRELNQSFGAA